MKSVCINFCEICCFVLQKIEEFEYLEAKALKDFETKIISSSDCLKLFFLFYSSQCMGMKSVLYHHMLDKDVYRIGCVRL